MSVRPLGVVLRNDVICIKGYGDHWPDDEAAFSYKCDTKTYYGGQKMASSLKTTVKRHKEGMYYPIKNTRYAFKIGSIQDGYARGTVTHDGKSECVPEEKTIPLKDLLLVSEYSSTDSSEFGGSQELHSSEIPRVIPTPPIRDPSGRLQSGPSIPAIVVGPIDRVYEKLRQLSSQTDNPITLVVTHENEPGAKLRSFDSMPRIASAFKRQGSMDEGTQGMSCGIEAVYNVGFESVSAKDFDRSAADGIDPAEFVASGMADDYLSHTGGGNNIPPNQMYTALDCLSEFHIEKNFHLHVSHLHTDEFWSERQWAVILIPACSGHWVSIEKIIYCTRVTFCLREGRGNTMYDFVKHSVSGEPKHLPSTGVKRKCYG